MRNVLAIHDFRSAPRILVPSEFRTARLRGCPLPIARTARPISQPYMVAAMTAALHLGGRKRVPRDREVALPSCRFSSSLAKEIITIEYRAELATDAPPSRLARLGYANVHVHCGDGTLGLPELAPFNAILVRLALPRCQVLF